VRTFSLDEIAQRLGLEPVAGSRSTPAGGLIRWRTVGIELAARNPALPFFIEWDPGSPFPGATASPAAVISRIEIGESPTTLSTWLGRPHSLPIRVVEGHPGLARVVLDAEHGEIAFDP
jgi:hypothetical protein